MTHIDCIPVDVWPNIFKNLSIQDLLNCRLVNKKFKDFSDHSDGINKLVIGKFNFYDYKYWFYNKELIKKEDVINRFKIYQIFKQLNLFNLERNLKYLIINGFKINFKLIELSNLNNLQFLKLKNLNSNEDQSLNLINLKFLLFKYCNFNLNLNAPKLERIKLLNINKINFESNPESIKHLITHDYDDQLRIFKNLEIIELEIPRADLIDIFIKLKKIKFNFHDSMDVVKNILRQKNLLKREIAIYFKDVKIDDTYRLDDYNHYKEKNDLIYQIENFQELDSNLSTIEVKLIFSDLEIWINNLEKDLPSSFFNKFNHLQSVHVYNDLINVNNLTFFLKNLINLKDLYLDLQNNLLNQSFYDNLPIRIRKLQTFSNSTINYNFIQRLINLVWFKTFNNVNLFNLATELFLNSNYLEDFQFKINENNVKIIKLNGKYDLIYSLNIERGLDYYQLVNSCNRLRFRYI